MKRRRPDVVTFRAYADEGKRYWTEVRVFPDPQSMQKEIRQLTGMRVSRFTAGQVNEMTEHRRGKRTGAFAVLWLNRREINKHPNEIIAHESVHCAARYFARRGWAPCLAIEMEHNEPDVHERRIEERFAYAVGRIARDITRGLYRHKIFE